MSRVKSPCIGVCSTGIGDSVCRGCKRYAHEVIHWNAYSDDERKLIYQRINGFLSQVVAQRIQIKDAAVLQAFIDAQNLSMPEGADDYVKVFTVLKAGAQQLTDLSLLGCELQLDWKHLDSAALRDDIDKHAYTLSSLHYERYFPH